MTDKDEKAKKKKKGKEYCRLKHSAYSKPAVCWKKNIKKGFSIF